MPACAQTNFLLTMSYVRPLCAQAMGTSAVLYWLVGMSGYLTFKSRTAGDLLRNFGAANVVGLSCMC